MNEYTFEISYTNGTEITDPIQARDDISAMESVCKLLRAKRKRYGHKGIAGIRIVKREALSLRESSPER